MARRDARLATRPRLVYPAELPVAQRADDIAAAIRAHPVVIVCGETGSGKTTQLPKICIAAGRGARGLIGHTQPRRLAARSVATRIAQELGSPLGGAVGYKVRFTDRTSPGAWVKLMTDGILLAETRGDRDLLAYDTIIVDEAHERSLNIDFLLGYLKQLLARRDELKLVITSATLDAERFARHFGRDDAHPAPVIEVSGRLYPVEVRYRAGGGDPEDEATDDEEDVEEAIVDAAGDLWREGPGDILAFLPGEREIRETAERLRADLKRRPWGAAAEILPLYARLSPEEQQRAFAPSRGRRIVLATNVAETSLTVPGIRYVIDTGLARIKRYASRNKTTLLKIEKIAQANADQRAGRCGRVQDGICVRLYAEADYAARPRFAEPEILRSSLASVILQMASLDLGAGRRVPVRRAAEPARDRRRLPAPGRSSARSTRARALTRHRARARAPAARSAHRPHRARGARARVPRRGAGDRERAVGARSARAPARQGAGRRPGAPALPRRALRLPVARPTCGSSSRRCGDEKLSHRRQVERCREVFVNHLRMREWRDVHRELAAQLRRRRLDNGATELPATFDAPRYRAIHEALLAGLLGERRACATARAKATAGRAACASTCTRAAGSRRRAGAASSPPSSSRRRGSTRVAPRGSSRSGSRRWPAIASRASGSTRPGTTKRGEVVARERVSLYGLTLVASRPVSLSALDPATAHDVFVREALVPGALATAGAFLAHNRRLVAEVAELEHKARRRDVLVDDDALAAFYAERVPKDVATTAAFERWRVDAEKRDAKAAVPDARGADAPRRGGGDRRALSRNARRSRGPRFRSSTASRPAIRSTG